MVQVHRTSSNLLEPHHRRDNKVCSVCSEWFDSTEPSLTASSQKKTGVQGARTLVRAHRTSSNHIMTEIAGRVEFFQMSSGWFDCTEPSLTTSLQGKQGVQGARALVRGGLSASNLLEPSRTTSSQR